MPQILVVDDEEDMRLTLSIILSQKGYGVDEAPSALAAYDKLGQNPYDLVLMDVRMPDIDGLQALKEIRKRGHQVPIIMVTGYQNVESAVDAMRLGASEFLKKPFDNQQLLSTIDSVLKHKKPGETAAAAPQVPAIDSGPVNRDNLLKPRSKISGKLLRSAVWAGAVFGIALLAGLSYFAVRSKTTSTAAPAIDLPFKNVSAVSWHENELWISDWFTHTIYQTRVKGDDIVIVKSYYLPQFQITGLCFVGDALYTCDASQKAIRKHKIDNWLTVVETHSSPGSSPSALSWDGQFLWSCDSDSGKIYKHILNPSFSTVASYDAPAKDPTGLYSDEHFFWCAGGAGRKVFRQMLNNQLSVVKSYSVPELMDGEGGISALTAAQGYFWITREGVNKLYRLPYDRFEKAASAQ